MPKVLERSIELDEAQTVKNRLEAPTPDDKNILNKDGQSGAMLACIHNKPDVLHVYINAEADLGLSDRQGYTAIAHAIKNVDKWKGKAGGQWQCVDMLVKHLGREVLNKAAAVNLAKTVEYILRGTDSWEIYLSAINTATDESNKINSIKNQAIQFGHREIEDLFVLAECISNVAIEVPQEGMELMM